MSASNTLPLEGWDSVLGQDPLCNDIVAFEALDIFPAEIWEMIFDPLKDPKDLIKCRRVCYSWNKILERRSSSYLFSLALPHLFPFLNKNDVLKCCQVSPYWKIAIDDFDKFLNETGTAPKIQLHFGYSKLTQCLSTSLFQSSTAPVNLAMYRNVSFQCPDFCHVVPLNEVIGRYYGVGGFQSKAMQYLGTYGRHIRNIRVVIHGEVLFDVVREYLELTPNLTTLNLSMIGCTVLCYDWQPTQTLERYPLPDLPHLTHLKYNWWCFVPINWLLFKYGANLKKLEILCGRFHNQKIVPYEGVNLSRLTNLEVHLGSREHIEGWRQLLQYKNVPLTQLSIKYESWEWEIGDAIAAFLNLFQNTLEELYVEYDYTFRDLRTIHCTAEGLQGLRLPKLKTMTLIKVGLPTVEMLSNGTPGLSKLRLRFMGKSDQEFYKKLYDEPLFWETLPSIKAVSVEWVYEDVYERLWSFKGLYSREVYKGLVAKKEKR